MANRVFVTGSSGFIGSEVIGQLLGKGYLVNALVNRADLAPRQGLTSFKGGMFDDRAIDSGMAGCDAVIHLVGIIFETPAKQITFERIHVEGTRSILAGAARNNIARYVQMSALGTRANAASQYHRTKWEAEELVRTSGLAWTIFRPSLIHGPSGEFTKMQAKWARKQAMPFLFMPYFGAGLFGTGGAGKLQPVYVEDVARALVEAIENPKAIGQTYCLGGPEQMTWPQMHQTAAEKLIGKKRMTLAVPVWYAKLLTKIVPGKLLPFNADQVTMSQEDGTCEMGKFVEDFGWMLRGFGKMVGEYAGRIG